MNVIVVQTATDRTDSEYTTNAVAYCLDGAAEAAAEGCVKSALRVSPGLPQQRKREQEVACHTTREEVVKGVSWVSIIPIHKKIPLGILCPDDFLSHKVKE